MKGGRNAAIIDSDLRREKIYRQKSIRQKCAIEGKKQCKSCKYQKTCTDMEVKDDL